MKNFVSSIVAEVGDVEIIEPVGEKPVKTRRTKKMNVARALLVLAKELVKDDNRNPEPGSIVGLLDEMGDKDSKNMPKVAVTEFIAKNVVVAIFPGENPRSPFMFYYLDDNGRVWYTMSPHKRGVVKADSFDEFIRLVKSGKLKAQFVERGKIIDRAPRIAKDMPKVAKIKSLYHDVIVSALRRLGRGDIDPRHAEAYLRVDFSTLDSLSRSRFIREIAEIIPDIDADPKMAERLAKSYGL